MKYLLNSKRWRLIGLAFFASGFGINLCNGQASSAGFGNFPQFGNDFLGWDNTVNSDVRIWHKTAAQPIIIDVENPKNHYLTT